MNFSTVLAFLSFFVVTWAVCFFAVLPWGVRNQIDEGEHIPGTERGAPIVVRMRGKLIATTVLSVVIVLLLMWGVSNPALQRYWGVSQTAETSAS
jgi:predicted secreted protein